MCGIVGSVGHQIKTEQLQRAVDSLRRRGPDGTGLFLDEVSRVALGHARLSIIDLQTGAQPLYSEQNDIILVCNGEIYEHERHRAELEKRGHVFRTRSDSEVILHLYQEHGEAFPDCLRGEFAFLLYDRAKRILFAVRDRFGIKPLFFNEQQGRYLFTSEAKAMFATGLLKPRISARAVRDFLSGVIPDSLFENVSVVPPGCFLKVSVNTRRHDVIPYWNLDLSTGNESKDTGNLEDAVKIVRQAVDEAISIRLRSDVPVGVYLSGGIDSSIVAATVAKYCPGRLKVFNIAFPGEEAFNEYQLAKNMAAKIGAEFHSVTCDPETLIENTEESLWVSELPFINFHGVGKFILSRLARTQVTVVLTGEGSDELFLGYVVFQPGKGDASDHMMDRLKPTKRPRGRSVRRTIRALGFLPMSEYAITLSTRYQRIITALFGKRHRFLLRHNPVINCLKSRIDRSRTDVLPETRQIQYFWIKSMLAPYILTMLGDRMEMAHSIEGRTPFLDHHLFEQVRHIPDSFKIHDGVEKYVLREAFREDLTDEIYRREKWPYSAPPLWIQKGRIDALDRLIERYLSRESFEKSRLFGYWVVRMARWLSRSLFFDCRLKRGLNSLLTTMLTVHILDHLYAQNFEASLQKYGRAVPYSSDTGKAPVNEGVD